MGVIGPHELVVLAVSRVRKGVTSRDAGVHRFVSSRVVLDGCLQRGVDWSSVPWVHELEGWRLQGWQGLVHHIVCRELLGDEVVVLVGSVG